MADFDPTDPYARERQAWQTYRKSRSPAVKAAHKELAEAFERIVQDLCRSGMLGKDIVSLTGVCIDSIRKIWSKANDYKPLCNTYYQMQEPEQPPEARYYPEPGGLGFVLTPEQYETLVKIRALKRIYGTNLGAARTQCARQRKEIQDAEERLRWL